MFWKTEDTVHEDFSLDGKFVCNVRERLCVNFWNRATGSLLYSLPVSLVQKAFFLPGGECLVFTLSKVQRYRIGSFDPEISVNSAFHPCSYVALSPKRTFFAKRKGGSIVLWDTYSLAKLSRKEVNVHTLKKDFSLSDDCVVSDSTGKKVCLENFRTNLTQMILCKSAFSRFLESPLFDPRLLLKMT